MTSDRGDRSPHVPYDARPLPRLSPVQLERLALLSEEMGEAQQAIGKILRHGLYSFNPDGDRNWQNYEQLEKELGDVFAAVELLLKADVVNGDRINRATTEKLEKVQKYLHYQP